MRKEVRSAMKKDKENWIERECKAIEQGIKKNDARYAFQIIKKITTETQINKTYAINDESGNNLTKKDVTTRWFNYCSSLYNTDLNTNGTLLEQTTTSSTCTDQTRDILRSEVEESIKHLKDNKSPRIDNIPAELIKCAGNKMTDFMHHLRNRMLHAKKWPMKWAKSILIPLPKKGTLNECANYRTVSLISHASKIMLRIILRRFSSQIKPSLAEVQAGFRKGRSTVEQIFNLRVICRNTKKRFIITLSISKRFSIKFYN